MEPLLNGVQIAARNLISHEHTPQTPYNSKKSNLKKYDDLQLLLSVEFWPIKVALTVELRHWAAARRRLQSDERTNMFGHIQRV